VVYVPAPAVETKQEFFWSHQPNVAQKARKSNADLMVLGGFKNAAASAKTLCFGTSLYFGPGLVRVGKY
jgi:hypothetical protein